MGPDSKLPNVQLEPEMVCITDTITIATSYGPKVESD